MKLKKLNFEDLNKVDSEKDSIDYSNSISTYNDEMEWLDLVENNNIPQGYALGCEEFDKHYRLKRKTMLGIFGIDNVGKTTFYIFMMVCYAFKYDLKFMFVVRENESDSVRQKIMELYLGREIHKCDKQDIIKARKFAYSHFLIIKNSINVTHQNLISMLDYHYSKESYFATFLDPYNAIQYEQSPKSNYAFLDKLRKFQNKYDTSFHISMHISTDKARNYVYNDKDTLTTFEGLELSVRGQFKIPRKNFVEGGQPIANKLDDIIIVHRILKMEELRNYTLISVDKVKEDQTGGMTTFENPLMFKKSYGFISFTDREGVNPLNNNQIKKIKPLPNQTLKDAFGDEQTDIAF